MRRSLALRTSTVKRERILVAVLRRRRHGGRTRRHDADRGYFRCVGPARMQWEGGLFCERERARFRRSADDRRRWPRRRRAPTFVEELHDRCRVQREPGDVRARGQVLRGHVHLPGAVPRPAERQMRVGRTARLHGERRNVPAEPERGVPGGRAGRPHRRPHELRRLRARAVLLRRGHLQDDGRLRVLRRERDALRAHVRERLAHVRRRRRPDADAPQAYVRSLRPHVARRITGRVTGGSTRPFVVP